MQSYYLVNFTISDCVCVCVCACIELYLVYISAHKTNSSSFSSQPTTDTLTQTSIDGFDVEYYIDGTDPTEPVITINAPANMTIIPNLMKGTTYGVRI